MKLSEILTNESMWIKGVQIQGERACLLGAMARSDNATDPALRLLRSTVKRLFPERLEHRCKDGGGYCFHEAIVLFNDHPQTTFSDVQVVMAEFDQRCPEEADSRSSRS
jgi:hypothetical protein